MVSIQIDTYGDARNNLGLVANALGSQLDESRIEPSEFWKVKIAGWS